MPNAVAMAHACCPPAPPKQARTWAAASYPFIWVRALHHMWNIVSDPNPGQNTGWQPHKVAPTHSDAQAGHAVRIAKQRGSLDCFLLGCPGINHSHCLPSTSIGRHLIGLHIVSLATRTNPMATSSRLLGGLPFATSTSLMVAVRAWNAAWVPAASSGSSCSPSAIGSRVRDAAPAHGAG